MAFSTQSRSVVVDMNVTPMIDVLLVLLISYFLFNLPMRSVPVMVPPPQGGPPGIVDQIVLELPNGGGFLLNGQPLADVELAVVLQDVFDGRPAKLLYVDAGGERTYNEVIEAMERARLAGVEVVAFMPRP